MSERELKWYRSNVGSLVYLAKLSIPDLENSVRELSKVMDGGTPAHKKEIIRLINLINKNKDRGLKIKPETVEMWKIEAFSDSDFARDRNDRKSVRRYIILGCGFPITWKSKSQPNVTLSSTETEYVALFETVREIKFMEFSP